MKVLPLDVQTVLLPCLYLRGMSGWGVVGVGYPGMHFNDDFMICSFPVAMAIALPIKQPMASSCQEHRATNPLAFIRPGFSLVCVYIGPAFCLVCLQPT